MYGNSDFHFFQSAPCLIILKQFQFKIQLSIIELLNKELNMNVSETNSSIWQRTQIYQINSFVLPRNLLYVSNKACSLKMLFGGTGESSQ